MNPTIVSNDTNIFMDALRSLGVSVLLSQAIKNLRAVRETNKSASVTVKLTIKPDMSADVLMLIAFIATCIWIYFTKGAK
ncbi:hypothetical protein KDD93_00030 [Campylobacter sp. faydin G-24]|uniref:Uncharacterized protein n=1 Tax=Campylobacter anatolicus TaxID=2829105 RepID=A0ABS5HFE6_9BACT|nr:hypothetical protein [Campylobacter anatolicus]MBR8462963.1 hypothetical protein [Campylobacter anatolicus]